MSVPTAPRSKILTAMGWQRARHVSHGTKMRDATTGVLYEVRDGDWWPYEAAAEHSEAPPPAIYTREELDETVEDLRARYPFGLEPWFDRLLATARKGVEQDECPTIDHDGVHVEMCVGNNGKICVDWWRGDESVTVEIHQDGRVIHASAGTTRSGRQDGAE